MWWFEVHFPIIRCRAPRKRNSSVIPATAAITNRLAKIFIRPSPAKSVLVSCSASASCAFIQFSTGAIKEGRTICLFKRAVRVMAGDIRNMLANTRSRILLDGLFFIHRYSFGAKLHSQATASEGNKNVPMAEINCISRMVSGCCMGLLYAPYNR